MRSTSVVSVHATPLRLVAVASEAAAFLMRHADLVAVDPRTPEHGLHVLHWPLELRGHDSSD